MSNPWPNGLQLVAGWARNYLWPNGLEYFAEWARSTGRMGSKLGRMGSKFLVAEWLEIFFFAK